MNLIVKGTTTWPTLQVGFEPWLLSGIEYLYQPNMTWRSIKMNLIIKGTTT